LTTAIGKPNTTLAGYTDYSTWYYSLADAMEQVPDLIWPASVNTYASMRRDCQLAAILSAFTLPLRRATWALDPAGCRTEVTQLVADDMGMPLLGADTPGPARIHGVSWPEHLRAALHALTFGSYGFEMLADVSSGQARLVGLYERTPSTIAFIHVDAAGDFNGISQLLRPGTDTKDADRPEIPAKDMVWYVHDREGSAWHGTSLLRPAFAPWLIKREMQRVLATSNRRFGMGVPNVEWTPTANPTPVQYDLAQEAASAARVGDTAGLTLPPGARLVLTGLSGSVPDTLGFLRWLDQQMSGSVLSRWMDLGSTQTGSRALGEAFIDVFMLTLQSIAEEMADQATRQIAARIVGWNWGEDEPVPRVTVSDVGTRHSVTAAALNALMAAGVLSADPELEDWVRRTYRLPPRDPDQPWVPPGERGAKPAAGSGDGSATDQLSTTA
jgi:hypothetical protein